MPVAQPQTRTTALQAGAPGYGFRSEVAARPERMAPPLPSPPARRPAPTPVEQPRHRVQMAWLLMLIFAASVVVAIGLVYLWGHAQVTREGYRRAQLMSMLRHEREMAQQWSHEQALVNTPAQIDARARAHHMVRAKDYEAITISPDVR